MIPYFLSIPNILLLQYLHVIFFTVFFLGCGLVKIKMPQYENASCIDSDNICRFKKLLSMDKTEIKSMHFFEKKFFLPLNKGTSIQFRF